MVPETTALSTELQVHKFESCIIISYCLTFKQQPHIQPLRLKNYSTISTGCKVFSFDGIVMSVLKRGCREIDSPFPIIESDSNATIHFYPQFCKNSIASYTLENVTLFVFNHWFLTSVSSIPGSPSGNNAFTVFFEFSTAF